MKRRRGSLLPRKNCMRYFIAAAGILLADQFVKAAVRAALPVGGAVAVLGNFFRITYIRNNGAAWGILSGMRGFLMVFPLVMTVLIVVFLLKNRQMHWLGKLSLTMIAAGGIGNFIDRIVFGYVTDMFSFSLFPPVFNVADIAVTVGCGLLMIFVFRGEKLSQKRG